ncbi:hypothetical protein CK5_32350 [Blautia obeum A2-162]|uniref:Uncharacterized protein n=1 Tax=Blautia obeum A2-162 TaxID=657314 RepID=D4LUI5_9FIRM|nr:hypothetical protein CK5_32350 [Blautia obeum A2-162]
MQIKKGRENKRTKKKARIKSLQYNVNGPLTIGFVILNQGIGYNIFIRWMSY